MLEKAESLIWLLLDEQITEDDVRQLEQMMQEHEAVRRRYLECAGLHADLHQMLGKQPELPPEIKSPVLGSLADLHGPDLTGSDSRSLPG